MLAMGSCFTSGLTPSSLISRGRAPWLTTLCWARPRPRPPLSVTSAWPPWPRAGLRSLMSRPEAGGQPTPAETASTRPLPSPTPGCWPTVSVTATHQTPTVRAAQRTRWGADVSVSNAFIICSPLYDPIIILVMELILLHIFHALSISHLTLRPSPQIRLLSQVQSLWPSLTVTRLFQSEDSSPLSQSCVASAQTIPSHPPAKTVSIVDYYSQVGHHSQSQGKALESSWILYFSSSSYLCWLHLNIMNFEYLLEKTLTCISYSSFIFSPPCFSFPLSLSDNFLLLLGILTDMFFFTRIPRITNDRLCVSFNHCVTQWHRLNTWDWKSILITSPRS